MGRLVRGTWSWRTKISNAVLLMVVTVALTFSLQPGALPSRSVFDEAPVNLNLRGVQAFSISNAVAILSNQVYRTGDPDALLDVYFPTSANQPGTTLPAVVWTHGGGWVAGRKDDAAFYFRMIAVAGYAVISLDYSLAPGKQYPTPIHQINDALAYIQENAGRFHVDANRIVLAGDSAGAQITSQIAAIITNPAFAAEMRITPALTPSQLRGVILHCGIYDMLALLEKADYAPLTFHGWGGTRPIVAAYTGTGSEAQDAPALRQMSTIDHVTSDFPPALISGGNGDRLTNDQSKPFAQKLEGLGVRVTALFYPEDHQPPIGHEYQFLLGNADAQLVLTKTLVFLNEQTTDNIGS